MIYRVQSSSYEIFQQITKKKKTLIDEYILKKIPAKTFFPWIFQDLMCWKLKFKFLFLSFFPLLLNKFKRQWVRIWNRVGIILMSTLAMNEDIKFLSK